MFRMLFCIFFYLYFATTPATCLSNETDFAALLAFKNAVDDDPSGALKSWNETAHFCEWEGILCSQRHRGRVVSLNLRSRGLVGSLPPHLGNLSFLRAFILQNNSFYGEIPEDFGRMRRLEIVEFSNNSFSGEIPRNLSQCSNLYYLNLIDNELTGIIIPELGSMFKLEALGLTTNNLSGTIPSFIGNLTSLTRLSLSNCGLEGEIPESLVQLRRLRFINLSNNKLTGEIPYGLYNISNITVFSMGLNGLHGNIPPDIGFTLPKLRVFDLGGNYFDGLVPVSISNASFLESIYLFFNKFTGQMPNDFHRLSALEELLIQFNGLEGDISFISSLTNCTNLESLDVSFNLLSGSLPDSIANLSRQLSQLYIGENQIQGTIPAGIENLIGLTILDFRNNVLEGGIPWGIGKLSKLQEIDMGTNKLTNEIPSSLGNMTLLNRVSFKENFLYGEIPQSLSNWKNLLSLDLSSNNLNGSIPRDVISLSSISIFFNMSHNGFTGPIPLEVGSLINLKDLDLSHNRLSGPIPRTFSSCIMLQRLHLERNSLEGEIPTGLSALKGLQELDLSQNNLSGSIPSFLANELNLISLNLSFNRLQGEVPTQGVFQNGSAISLEGNDNLCGRIASLKLPPCPSTNFKKKHFSNLWKILISVLGAGAICLTLSVCIWIFVFRRRISQEARYSVPSLPESFLRLSFEDLVKATDGFSEANLLGSGRFGSVYEGILEDKQMSVAVKVLNLEIKGASKSFTSECNAIRGIRHRNLLKILSVCESIDSQGNNFKALVYEFMAYGSLDKWLHKNLSLAQRLNIAIDVASAVEYLHNGTDSVVVHGDLKPSNILLDEHLTAHVGDFGLAKVISNICPPNETGTNSAAIKGTIGYIPPEYGMTNDISIQGDIYSCGIFLLEMITNIRPTDDAAFGGHSNLHDLVSHALQSQETDQIIPREHTDSKIKNCMTCILQIGVACSKESPKDRMQMNDVVRKLHDIQKAYLA
ncbi:receptor kinase-like protein Xa21 [Primulina tabacum]|uniref:receptor kinase-like protein Xa21 n=1 Tax=Primulina tabacum TaxID=48773 RepID=UPI003F598498